MGKIVKYCSSCEEGFAEKFSFCPNCANELSAFEMKPIAAEPDVSESVPEKPAVEPVLTQTETASAETIIDETFVEDPVSEDPPALELSEPFESEPAIEETVFEPVSFDSDEEELMIDEFNEADEDDVLEVSVEGEAEPEEESIAAAAPEENPEANKAVPAAGGVVTSLFGDEGIPEVAAGSSDSAKAGNVFHDQAPVDENYHVTVIGDGEGNLRSRLMLGASILVLTVVFGSVLYSIFNHPFFVASIDDDYLLAPIVETVPMPIEEEPKKDNDKDGGGGGGGGRDNKKPASAGELPPQTRDPIPQPPQVIPRLSNPSLPQIQRTEGDIKRERTERVGIPGSLNGDASSGSGSGGGIGEGRGTGAGNGRGTGEGNGIGSGSGNGNGDGNGDGNGPGNGARDRTPPPVRPSGPTTGIQIRSKPRPGYTDTARQNNVQGTVMLRVTFQANGTIGSISPIKGLPNGLTEKAIAAARQISFTPAMRNGQPYSVTKSIQYNFTIY
ncbi:MAG: energy transducer TonB [Acidobacteria bacterium]|nr:energy transducer TonB [Acidobacteriota bacterium]